MNRLTNHGAFSVTDAEGKFRVVQRAEVGTDRVFFSKIEGGEINEDPESGMEEGRFAAIALGNTTGSVSGDLGRRQSVPVEHSSVVSDLTFEVRAGDMSAANFKLCISHSQIPRRSDEYSSDGRSCINLTIATSA